MARQEELEQRIETLLKEKSELEKSLKVANLATDLARNQRDDNANRHLSSLVEANMELGAVHQSLKEAQAYIKELDGKVSEMAKEIADTRGRKK